MRILVVEDDALISNAIEAGLKTTMQTTNAATIRNPWLTWKIRSAEIPMITYLPTTGISASQIAAQKSAEWFRERCDFCLENNGTQADFQETCLAFLRKLGIMKTN